MHQAQGGGRQGQTLGGMTQTQGTMSMEGMPPMSPANGTRAPDASDGRED